MKHIKRLLSESKHYILAAFLIFLVAAWLGFFFHEELQPLGDEILGQLDEVAEEIAGNESLVYMFWVIFQNNVRVSLLMIGLGTVFFIFPIFSLFVNGIMIGYFLKMNELEGLVAPLDMLIFGLMPHGILELPALFVSSGVGIFLGIQLLKWLFGRNQFFAHWLGKERADLRSFWEESKSTFIQRIQGGAVLAVILVVTLFVAALIETVVTPFIVINFIDLGL